MLPTLSQITRSDKPLLLEYLGKVEEEANQISLNSLSSKWADRNSHMPDSHSYQLGVDSGVISPIWLITVGLIQAIHQNLSSGISKDRFMTLIRDTRQHINQVPTKAQTKF